MDCSRVHETSSYDKCMKEWDRSVQGPQEKEQRARQYPDYCRTIKVQGESRKKVHDDKNE